MPNQNKHPQALPKGKDNPPLPAPIVCEKRYLNCGVGVGSPDAEGNQEITFIVGPGQLETFVLNEEVRRVVAGKLTGGLHVVGADEAPPEPPNAG